MLAKGERYAVLRFISYCCKFAPFQAQVNLSSWNLEKPGRSRRCASSVCYCNFFLHTLFKLFSLLYVFAFDHDTPTHHVILHLALTFGYVLTCFWFWTAYIKNLDLHKALVQIILRPVQTDGKDCCGT